MASSTPNTQRFAAQSVIQQRRGPIAMLANEILLTIFLLHRPSHSNDAVGDWTWLSIIHVCKRWRDIALLSAQMWTEIICSRHTSLTEFMLEHSQNMPLLICHTHAPKLLPSFRSILSRANRIQNVTVRAEDGQLLDLLLKSFSTSPENILSVFDYDILPINHAEWHVSDGTLNEQFISQLPKRLVWLKLPRIRVISPFMQVQTFDNLTEFLVKVVPPTSLADIHALLGHFPNLEVFTLHSYMNDVDHATLTAQTVTLQHLKVLTFAECRPLRAVAHLGSMIMLHADLCINLQFLIIPEYITGIQLFLQARQRQGRTLFPVGILLQDNSAIDRLKWTRRLLIQCNSFIEPGSELTRHPATQVQGPRPGPGIVLLNGMYQAKTPTSSVIQQIMPLLELLEFRHIQHFTVCIQNRSLPYQPSALFPVLDQLVQLTHLQLDGFFAIYTIALFVQKDRAIGYQGGKIPFPSLQHLALRVPLEEHDDIIRNMLNDIVDALRDREACGGQRLQMFTIRLEKDSIQDVVNKLPDSGITERYDITGPNDSDSEE
ncbi:uncharacterized protein STEHIDRAFT_164287 [Stereum hirsutum FP-91666 SS1]|uniref:uncharacterized protein n=1 Tax=Stereum hirsutum (strain FP-91666) TaxID=721885 RepID=UPI000440CF86|nr:uncharacterized protein STEHIDRAFT_164287 [Stereum hirsutum FP-91666 SS1]EIM91850.1 hypothetical protein STEHIDRAFT_164287 [Stereum hirsutum FP-91666 SS1]